MNDAASVLVIMLAIVLIIFLIIAMVLIVYLIKITKKINAISDDAKQISSNLNSVTNTAAMALSPVFIKKMVKTWLDKAKTNKKKEK